MSRVRGDQSLARLATLKREIEDGHQTLEVSPPVILCALSGLPEPRYPSLKGIMASRRKQIESKKAADLGIEVVEVEYS
jgi:electron transfer flavoprotein beta subunit